MFGKYKSEGEIIEDHVKEANKRNIFIIDGKGDLGILEKNFLGYLASVPPELVDKFIDKVIDLIQEQRMNAELLRQREKMIKEKMKDVVIKGESPFYESHFDGISWTRGKKII